jgi:hypothetical protein
MDEEFVSLPLTRERCIELSVGWINAAVRESDLPMSMYYVAKAQVFATLATIVSPAVIVRGRVERSEPSR